MALGAINAGGGWGILIPPSILMVLYSLITEVSVGRLFAAGIGPGILLFVLVSIYIVVRCCAAAVDRGRPCRRRSGAPGARSSGRCAP